MGTEVAAGVMVAGIAKGMIEGRAAKKVSRQEAAQLELKSKFSKIQVEQVKEKAKKDVFMRERQTRKVVGSQQAILGAAGVDLGEGTAFDIQEEAYQIGIEDAEAIQNNALLEIWGLETESLQLEQVAADTRRAGKRAQTAAIFGGVVSGASSYAQMT